MSELFSSQRLHDKLTARANEPSSWQEPEQFDLSDPIDRVEIEHRLDSGEITNVVDRIAEVSDELFEMHHPDLVDDDRARAEFAAEKMAQKESYGMWFYFSWNRSLVRYPGRADHQELRTFRNKNLVTDEEQARLLGARAAVFGLSVGSNVLEQIIQSGIGGHVTIGDFDRLSPTNLNRIRAGFPDVGMKKLDIAAIKISEIDPYIKQTHYHDGVTLDTFDQLRQKKPDVIFDEVDDLAIKAMLRRFAAEERVPLLMATDIADTSLLDVERYDINPDTKPFHGKLKTADVDRLLSGDMSEQERKKLMIKIVGAKHISPRMLQSAMGIGKELGGLPQLGATAALGGSLAAVAARELLLGRKLDTGRYAVPMRKSLGLQHVTSVREGLETVVRFVRASK